MKAIVLILCLLPFLDASTVGTNPRRSQDPLTQEGISKKHMEDAFVGKTMERVGALLSTAISMASSLSDLVRAKPEGETIPISLPPISAHIPRKDAFPEIFVKTPPATIHVPVFSPDSPELHSGDAAQRFMKEVMDRAEGIIRSTLAFQYSLGGFLDVDSTAQVPVEFQEFEIFVPQTSVIPEMRLVIPGGTVYLSMNPGAAL